MSSLASRQAARLALQGFPFRVMQCTQALSDSVCLQNDGSFAEFTTESEANAFRDVMARQHGPRYYVARG